jgi:hypothetical protein
MRGIGRPSSLCAVGLVLGAISTMQKELYSFSERNELVPVCRARVLIQ